MANGGWIKLHRELLGKAIWKCSTPDQKVILITLLLMASHKDHQWMWKGKKFTCRPGQFVTSLASLQKATGCTVKKIRYALLKFENLEFLTNETTKTGRLITIVNWEAYQLTQEEEGKAKGKRGAKEGQRSGNYQEGKNVIIKKKQFFTKKNKLIKQPIPEWVKNLPPKERKEYDDLIGGG